MARYDLPPIQSMYRDPQSVAINTALRQRFVENFAADDQLAASVDAMESTDFEGDEARKRELIENYNTKLDERSSQRDYENMGMAIARDARSFVKDYTPLKENKKAYDTWKAKVDASHESYNTGKGGLNNEEYLLMLEKAKHGYTGLEYSEEGTLNEDSYFSGQEFGRSVDEIAELDQALKGIEPNSYENLGVETPLADLVQDKHGNIRLDKEVDTRTGAVKYWVTNKNGTIEIVKKDRVEDLARAVLDKPEISGGMKQRVDLDTFKLNDISEDGVRTNAQVQADEYQTFVEKSIADLQNKPTLTQEEEAQLARYQEELNRVTQARQEPGGDLKLIQDKMYENEYNKALDFAVGKYSYKRGRGGRSFRTDAEYLKGKVKDAKDTSADGLKVYLPALQYHNPVLTTQKGKDHKGSHENYVNKLKSDRDGTIDVFNESMKENGGTGEYTVKQIMDEKEPYFIIDDNGFIVDTRGTKDTNDDITTTADASQLTMLKTILRTNLENEQMADQLVQEGKLYVNYDDRVKKAIEKVTASEIQRGMQIELFKGYEFSKDYGNALATGKVTDMVDFYNQISDPHSPLHKEIMNKYGYTETSPGSGLYYSLNSRGHRIISAKHLIAPGSRPSQKELYDLIPEKERTYIEANGNTKRYTISGIGHPLQQLVNEIDREATGDRKKADADLNNYLEERKDSKTSLSTQRWPGRNKEESDRHQTMVTERIKETKLPGDFEIVMSDGTKVSAKNGIADLNFKSYEVTAVDWTPDPITGEIMYAVSIEGEDVETGVMTGKTVMINADQITYVNKADTDFVQAVKNSVTHRIEHKAHKAQYLYGLDSTTVKVSQANKDDLSKTRDMMFEYDFKKNKMKVFKLQTNGSYTLYKSYEIGSDAYYDVVNDKYLTIRD